MWSLWYLLLIDLPINFGSLGLGLDSYGMVYHTSLSFTLYGGSIIGITCNLEDSPRFDISCKDSWLWLSP